MTKDRDKTRQKAAEARAQAEAAERRRERTVRIVGAAGVVVVVALIVAGAILIPKWANNSPDPGPNPSAALPKGVAPAGTEYPYGVTYNPEDAGKPVLAIWEDFQCPACGYVEKQNGLGIQQLATEGVVQLVWRPTTFLDSKLKNDASVRATAAWGCAIDAGKSADYHNWLFANQPATEGDGWTNDQLLTFGKDVGITGDAYTTFESCVNAQTYAGWANNSTDQFYTDDVSQTPSATINGTPIENAVLADPVKFKEFIEAYVSSQSPTPTASSSASAS